MAMRKSNGNRKWLNGLATCFTHNLEVKALQSIEVMQRKLSSCPVVCSFWVRQIQLNVCPSRQNCNEVFMLLCMKLKELFCEKSYPDNVVHHKLWKGEKIVQSMNTGGKCMKIKSFNVELLRKFKFNLKSWFEKWQKKYRNLFRGWSKMTLAPSSLWLYTRQNLLKPDVIF